MTRTHAIARVLVVFVIASGLGCREVSDGVHVSGKVAYNDKPVASGAVTFFPSEGRPVVAPTDEAGAYRAGLAPGEYQVVINVSVKLPPGWKEGDPLPRQEMVIPAEYTSRARTPLKATVTANQTEPIDFVLP